MSSRSETVEQIIARIPAWQDARQITHERIAGLTNANYCVTVDGERYVLRVSGENTQQLGIDRCHELAALQAAAAAGIGPAVVAFLPPEGHLVTRFVDGRIWSAHEFRTPEHVRLLTDTVKRIHRLPSNGAFFSPFRRVEQNLATAFKFSAERPEGFECFMATMLEVHADQASDPLKWHRFCHNDLASVNYLFSDTEQRITVLDWEFAGVSDIYYDLACVSYTHDSDGPISQQLEEVMLEHYFGEVTPFRWRRLQGMKFMLMLFSATWGLAQYAMQQAGLISPPQDFDYLEFARYVCEYDLLQLQEQYECLPAKPTRHLNVRALVD